MEPNSIRILPDGTLIWLDDAEDTLGTEANILRIHNGFIGAVDRNGKHVVFVGLPKHATHPDEARVLLAALAASMGIPKEEQ